MRRPLFALVGLSFVITVLIGLKSVPVAHLLGWSAESAVGPDGLTGDAGGDGGSGGAGGGSTTPDPSAQPGGSSPGGSPSGSPTPSGPAGSSAPGGTTTTSRPPTATTTSAPASTTYTGAAIQVKTAQSPTATGGNCSECASYTISVTITVSNGKITATSVAYNPSPGGSQSYASSANNTLKTAILTTQTWNLGKVSRATFAGNAWETSAKDAMSKAGLPV